MKKYYSGLIALIFSIFIITSSPVSSYLANVQTHNALPVFDNSTDLKAKIRRESVQHEIKPINARNDSIWKLVPGLDGQIVNQEKTLQQTIKQDAQQIKWVYQPIKPKVNLSDLGLGPIYRGNEQKTAVALMINVAWGTEYLSKMLDIFKREHVHVTFFLDGTWLNNHWAEGLKLVQDGHEIGNHGYNHPLMSQVTEDRMVEEIGKTEAVIKKVYHHPSKWFAPPAGDFNERVVRVADKFQLGTVLWTLDTIDWRKTTTAASMVQKIETKVGPGNLILMHPTDRTVQALPGIIKAIKQKGYRLITVSELLSTKRITPLRDYP